MGEVAQSWMHFFSLVSAYFSAAIFRQDAAMTLAFSPLYLQVALWVSPLKSSSWMQLEEET